MALFILYFLPSTTPQSAQCGISRIWVHSQYRRKKVATRLLDCVRWEASDCALIFWRTCSRRFLPFSKRGDRASERENKHAWGEQKKGRSGEVAVNEKRRRSRRGLGRKFFPHCTRSQLRSLRVLLDMNSCYAGCLNFHWLNTTWTPEPCLVGLETQSFYLYWMKYIFFFPGWTSFTAVLFPGNLWRFLIPHQTASDLLKVTLALHSSSCLDSFALVAFQFPDS